MIYFIPGDTSRILSEQLFCQQSHLPLSNDNDRNRQKAEKKETEPGDGNVGELWDMRENYWDSLREVGQVTTDSSYVTYVRIVETR